MESIRHSRKVQYISKPVEYDHFIEAIKRLRDEGYEVEIRDKHLLIHHVPYVTALCASALSIPSL